MPLLDQFKAYMNSLKEPEQRLAWAIAIAADVLQIAAFPLFVEGGISPADSALRKTAPAVARSDELWS